MDFGKFWGGKATPYQIEQSLRFPGNAYLYRTPGSNFSGSGRTYTTSFWVKRSKLDSENYMFAAGTGGSFYSGLTWNTSNYGSWNYVKNDGMRPFFEAGAMYADPSAWYHFVVVANTTSSTSSQRDRFYINGVEYTYFPVWKNESSQNQSLPWMGSTATHYIGSAYNGQSPLDGYMAEFQVVDGQALAPTAFGEFDSNGVWRPIPYGGSYGNQGFYLKFDPSASNGIGHDHSGNGNHWSSTGFTPTNTTNPRFQDVVYDTPTNNFATFDPLYNYESNAGIFEGNLKTDTNSGTNVQNTTLAVKEGKYYIEFYCEVSNTVPFKLGIQDMTGRRPSHPENNTWTLMFQGSGSNYIFQDGSWSNPGSSSTSFGNGDYVGLALDADARTCRLYKNGSQIANINFSSYWAAGERWLSFFHCYAAGSGAAVAWINCGQQPWKYSPPTGYKALCTNNLPAPTIKDGGDYFKALTYQGNGGTLSVSGVGFAPDFVWIKNRTAGRNHQLFDTSRGAGKTLYSNLSNSESTNQSGGYLSSFNTDGFTVTGGVGDVNANDPYVAYCWKKAAGVFDIVTYNGTNSAQSISHNLGVVPKLMIIKCRNANSSWQVYHHRLGNRHASFLDQNGVGVNNDNSRWNSTTPTSTHFTVGTDGGMNGSGRTFVAYLFAEIPGYSDFNYYKGNGNSPNGPCKYTGHTPAFTILKSWNENSNWIISDKARVTYGNPINKWLRADTADTESTDNISDFNSQSIKRRNGNHVNSSYEYFTISFGSIPVGGTDTTPAPAR